MKALLVLFALILFVQAPVSAAPAPQCGHLIGWSDLNPLVYWFYRDPANQLKLMMPHASGVLLEGVRSAFKAINLPVSIAKGIVEPIPDAVRVEVWDSNGWQSGYFLRVVMTIGGEETVGDFMPITKDAAEELVMYRVS
jgi:hypothetical protein